MSKKVLLTDFSINIQTAENLGYKEMVSGYLGGFHYFSKLANSQFKDLNQQDEFELDGKRCKLYIRTAINDEDILIDADLHERKPFDYYLCLKIKNNKYNFLGFVTRETVDKTPKTAMISGDGTKSDRQIRRIFAEQYKNLSELLKIEIDEDESSEKIADPQNICMTNIHTEFSLGKAFGKPDYIADILHKKGIKIAAITDYYSLGGVFKWQKLMLEKDIKPIIGITLDVKYSENHKGQLVLYVKNDKGWENLLKIQNNASRYNFYYHPIADFKDILEFNEGLFCISNDENSLINKAFLQDDFKLAKEIIDKLKKSYENRFKVQIYTHYSNKADTLFKYLKDYAKENEIECILGHNVFYPLKEDEIYFKTLSAINTKKKINQIVFSENDFYIMNDLELEAKIKDFWLEKEIGELITNSNNMFSECDFIIKPPSEQDTLPEFEVLYYKDEFNQFLTDYKWFLDKIFKDIKPKEKDYYLAFLTFKGLIDKKLSESQEYIDRASLELERIVRKEYTNYFLSVWDYVKYCKNNGIMVGPGRGSVGGSLIAFSIDITSVDPIKHNLLFDRFISDARRDAPDIDLDFMDKRRKEVFDYLIDKYGDEHCAKVITYSTFHAKGILRDVGRIFDINSFDINKICSMVIERSGGDARASFSLLDTFTEFEEARKFQEKYPVAADIACKLEGHIRHKGVHAAAMIISKKPICNYVPTDKVNGVNVTAWEKFQCEEMKLIKFDILGLKTLSVIRDAVESIGEEILPDDFEDIKVYENIFQNSNTAGVFQFETVGLTKLVREISVKNFAELYDASALFRPGALHSGQTQVYVNRAKGLEPEDPFHEKLTDITKESKGIVLYQEQIMIIMNRIGHMSWATAEMARKVITKSKGANAFNDMRSEFVKNSVEKTGLEKDDAENLFDVVSTFGSYGFNKSHSVEYSIISYWCAWLKYYYPSHFYSALLKNELDADKQLVYLEDAKKNNIKIFNPNINKSKIDYSIFNGDIYAGFKSVNGIADKTAEKIIKNQPYTDLNDFKTRCKVSKKILDGLIISGAFDDFNINKKKEVEDCEEDYTEVELAQLLYKYTSLVPKIKITDIYDFGDYNFVDIKDVKNFSDKIILIRGIATIVLNKDKLLNSSMNSLSKHKHQFEKHMYYVNLNDGTGDLAVQINPNVYEKYKEYMQDLKTKPLIFLGKINKEGTKMLGSVMEIVNETDDIKNVSLNIERGEEVIFFAQPLVSKNGNSFYIINTSKNNSGMLFNFEEDRKIYAGFTINNVKVNSPFINFKY